VIPLRDENPTSRLSILTILIIAINIIVFLYELTLSPRQLDIFMYRYGAIPYAITQGVVPYGYPMPLEPVYLTLFTAMFVHSGWFHLGGNMLFLWIFGNNIEDRLGYFLFPIFYFLCGLGAAGLQIAASTDSQVPMVGASGAISGLLAAYLVLYPRARVLTLVFLGFFVTIISLPAVVVIGLWILLQLFSGIASIGTISVGGVAYFAHIGGFIAGLLAILPFKFTSRSYYGD